MASGGNRQNGAGMDQRQQAGRSRESDCEQHPRSGMGSECERSPSTLATNPVFTRIAFVCWSAHELFAFITLNREVLTNEFIAKLFCRLMKPLTVWKQVLVIHENRKKWSLQNV
ncbi:unnamed protein product [Anisakis simplex]|uniref:Uncharacterized protein n=1 Tax=Anisakis simplex TaxID=6269 RepID=A0A0M3KFK1_ANISI|nr:unnamed protein product [Anisakis simplex]